MMEWMSVIVAVAVVEWSTRSSILLFERVEAIALASSHFVFLSRCEEIRNDVELLLGTRCW